jgi:hypothetical protein
MRLVRAVVVVAVSALSIGAVPAWDAAGEDAAPPAQRQVTDPAVRHLAAEKGLSIAEAQRRIDVQQRAPKLDETLAGALGPARYGGVWIGDDDRVKVGIVEAVTRPAVTAAAAAHQLVGEFDPVPVRHSLVELLVANAWLADQVSRANVNAKSEMVTGYKPSANTVQLGVPPDTEEMSPGQGAVLDEARQRYGSMLSTYTVTGRPRPTACGTENNRLTCDTPLRAGVWIAGGETACTLGFLARSRSDNTLYGLTAGHCLKDESATTTWYTYDRSGNTRTDVGTMHRFVYGEGDAGLINIGIDEDDKALQHQIDACGCSWVLVLDSSDTTRNEQYPIYGTGNGVEGLRVCHTGAANGTNCGQVVRLGVTSSTGVRNLVETNYCGGDGDSGGPVYAGNIAYGLHQGKLSFCDSLYQGARDAENLMNVNIMFNRFAIPNSVYWRHNKAQLSPRKYNFSRLDGQLCHYRIRYGDFGTVAFAQVRFYGGPCGGTGVELFGEDWKGRYKATRMTGGQDECGPYFEIQAISPAGVSAGGLAVVTPENTRIYYSHNYFDRLSNTFGEIC